MFHEVITTERVPLRYRVAGIGSRLLAWLLDLCLIILLDVAGFMAAAMLEIGRTGTGIGIFMIWGFVLQWGYFIFFEWAWHGQTPGKRLLGIRVIRVDGTGIQFAQSAVRNILRVADGLPIMMAPIPMLETVVLPYGLGFLISICNREQRRLGDLVAGTLVVHIERRRPLVQAMAARSGEWERSRQLVIRQRLSQLDHEQKQAMVDLCLRREQLAVAERTRLFHAVAGFFKARLDLGPAEFQSDEKFILELAAALTERLPAGEGSLRAGQPLGVRGS